MPAPDPPTSPALRPALAFALLGGAIAWTVHLIGASLISEWGCLTGMQATRYAGVSVIAWAILLLSILMFLIAAAAAWVGYRTERRVRELEAEVIDSRETARFVAHAGLLTSSLFTFIIFAESLPLLFFLSEC